MTTFKQLEIACKQKGIVCERTGRTVELTTPDGGTTAECETVGEAVNTFFYDHVFASLPVKQN